VETRTIGRTEIAVTTLGFGGASLGNLYRTIDDATAERAVAAAFDAGIRYFDTAPHYGLGLSERRLGRALNGRAPADYVVSTKVGRLLEPNPAPTGSDLAMGGFDVADTLRRRFDFSRDGVRRSLESSLYRLGIDRVDIVYVHDPDDHLDQAIVEAIPALIGCREEGVVGAIGVGMNSWPAPLRIVRETPIDVVMLAGRWTLLDRSGRELLDECARRGVSVVAAAPYNSGVLAHDRPLANATFDYERAGPELIAQVNRLADACERHGVTLPAAALQFPLRHRSVASVVAGTRTSTEVSDAVNRLAAPVPEALWQMLEGWREVPDPAM
jgi:D-threo-aldose 1-dehydrogenase